jgi:hypothetical protein
MSECGSVAWSFEEAAWTQSFFDSGLKRGAGRKGVGAWAGQGWTGGRGGRLDKKTTTSRSVKSARPVIAAIVVPYRRRPRGRAVIWICPSGLPWMTRRPHRPGQTIESVQK